MREKPERLAWRILLASFIAFLLICGGTIYLAQWYVFQSTVGLTVTLDAARGTVRMTLPSAQDENAVTGHRDDLTSGASVYTDGSAQGVVTFIDPSSGEPLASLVVLRDSQITIREATAPRYSLNPRPYRIVVESSGGWSEVFILDGGRSGISFALDSPQATTLLSLKGQYSIDVTDQSTQVTARSGQATVVDKAGDVSTDIPAGKRTVVASDSSDLTLLDAEKSLLANGDFSAGSTVGWGLEGVGDPSGQVYFSSVDGREALVLDRSQANWPTVTLGHGETRLYQTLDIDVQSSTSLELRATFYVAEQSLSTCGVEGSECPMMIRMKYIDVSGTEQEYIHGFYAYHDPAQNYPQTCATCRTDHERINMNTWYTFRSGNLLTLLPPEQQPVRIQEIAFYASGHAYKVYVGEISLLATVE